jgi:hypothetical protein
VSWRRPEVLRLSARIEFSLGNERRARSQLALALAEAETLEQPAERARAHADAARMLASQPETMLAGCNAAAHREAGAAGLRGLGLMRELRALEVSAAD